MKHHRHNGKNMLLKVSVYLILLIGLSHCSEEDRIEFADVNGIGQSEQDERMPVDSAEQNDAAPESSSDEDTNQSNAEEVIEAFSIRPCEPGGGKAGETGLKTWCWQDLELPEYSGLNGVPFSNGQLAHDSECNEKQISIVGNEVRFYVDPTHPEPGSWCANSYNMRAEIRTMPWKVRHPKGTEEWFGWTYRFGDSYRIDPANEWLIFQVHSGVIGASPHLEFLVSNKDQFKRRAGEIYVINKGNNNDVVGTGFIPRAGNSLSFVVHAVWDDSTNGKLQVWVNGKLVYDKQVATVNSEYPWGGNAKFGIYKWPWRSGRKVQSSSDYGIHHVETFMGPLRILTRRPDDPEYGTDAYELVAPYSLSLDTSPPN